MAEKGPIRQRLAQEIVRNPGDYSVIDEFNRRRERRALQYNMSFGEASSEALIGEIKDMLHNFTLESTVHAALLSAIQVNVEIGMADITRRLRQGEAVHPSVYQGSSDTLKGPFPTPIRTLNEQVAGVSAAATIGAGREDPTLVYTRAKMNLLHMRLLEAHDHIAARGVGGAPDLPERLFLFEPPDHRFFTPEERELVLQDGMDPQVVVGRLIESGVIDQDQQVDQDVNSSFFMSALFAGSYAIEEKYPGISVHDATRLLLYNADQLGRVTYPRVEDSLYAFMEVGPLEQRGTFPWLISHTTGDKKMILDDADRLHVPLPQRSRGTCPLSYTYKVYPEQKAYLEDFNREIEQIYDVQLPTNPHDNNLALATQFFIIGVPYGEPLMNGRTHEFIQGYYAGRLS